MGLHGLADSTRQHIRPHLVPERPGKNPQNFLTNDIAGKNQISGGILYLLSLHSFNFLRASPKKLPRHFRWNNPPLSAATYKTSTSRPLLHTTRIPHCGIYLPVTHCGTSLSRKIFGKLKKISTCPCRSKTASPFFSACFRPGYGIHFFLE